MLQDEVVKELEDCVSACEAARDDLEAALADAEREGDPGEAELQAVASAVEDWRDAQRQFHRTVAASGVDDVPTAAMLLKTNHGIRSDEARRGIPGVHVEGADQPFDVDLGGTRGTILTNAVMQYVSASEE